MVYISLSDNDLLQRYPVEGEAVFAEIEADLRTIAAELTDVRADVRLILAGYDILNFDRSAFYQDMAQLTLAWHYPLRRYYIYPNGRSDLTFSFHIPLDLEGIK